MGIFLEKAKKKIAYVSDDFEKKKLLTNKKNSTQLFFFALSHLKRMNEDSSKSKQK